MSMRYNVGAFVLNKKKWIENLIFQGSNWERCFSVHSQATLLNRTDTVCFRVN